MTYKRTISVERASVDLEAGTFDAVVFTGGEASDGHILNMAGARVPEKIPMFVNHAADPRTQLGSLRHVRTEGDQVVMRGEILTEGTGAEAEIRRDLLLKIAHGHVSSMSGRWDAGASEIRRRADLPKDHPAYPGKDASHAAKYGSHFDGWDAMEGSVVGLGADPAAVMRFAEDPEATEAVRGFWRELVESGDDDLTPSVEDADASTSPAARELTAMAEAFEERIGTERTDTDEALDAIHQRLDALEDQRELAEIVEARGSTSEPAESDEAEDRPRRAEEGPRPEPECLDEDSIARAFESVRQRARLESTSTIRKLRGNMT